MKFTFNKMDFTCRLGRISVKVDSTIFDQILIGVNLAFYAKILSMAEVGQILVGVNSAEFEQIVVGSTRLKSSKIKSCWPDQTSLGMTLLNFDDGLYDRTPAWINQSQPLTWTNLSRPSYQISPFQPSV